MSNGALMLTLDVSGEGHSLDEIDLELFSSSPSPERTRRLFFRLISKNLKNRHDLRL